MRRRRATTTRARTHLEDALGVEQPSLIQADLEEASRDPRGALRDKGAVGDESEGTDGQPRDVGLHEDVGLALLVGEARLDRQPAALEQVLELLHLLLADLDV